jgi:hypothetical protein
MQRDMDLVRQMLLEIEALPPREVYHTSSSTIEADSQILDAHLGLLNDAGFVANYSGARRGSMCTGLTWAGHEFLNNARSDTVWNAAKAKVQESGLSVSLTVMAALLETYVKGKLGLGD